MKRTRTKHKKRSTLKRKAWGLFSKYIRERDKYTCITCGNTGKGGFMGAGHYISRRFGATMFDERNVHAQCVNCNVWKSGNIGVYTLKLQKKYGEGIIKELTKKSNSKNFQMTTLYLEQIIEIYKEKLKEYE